MFLQRSVCMCAQYLLMLLNKSRSSFFLLNTVSITLLLFSLFLSLKIDEKGKERVKRDNKGISKRIRF